MSKEINIKTTWPPNQPKGAWYRAVLHFGVFLMNFVEKHSQMKEE